VSLEDSNGEGWANLGLAFGQMGKLKESLKCLEEGYKRSRSWKICENIMYVAIEAKELNKLIIAINNMYRAEQCERIRPTVFRDMISLFLSAYSTLDQNQIKYFKSQIYNIFETFSASDGTTPEIWNLYALFAESVEILCVKNSITQEEEEKVLKGLVELSLKQGRCLMREDIWEKTESMVEKVSVVVKQIEEYLTRIKDEDYKQEINVFTKNVIAKIEKFHKLKEINK
jgi:hypothetical protein